MASHGGCVAEPGSEPIQQQRPPDEPEERHAGEQVNGDVDQVITAGVQFAGRVVERERQVDDGASGVDDAVGPAQAVHVGVVHDSRRVVEQEGPAEAVGVGRDPARDHDPHEPAASWTSGLNPLFIHDG